MSKPTPMGRILAIDYGSKRVGLAVTDSLQLIASGLTTVHSKDVIRFLKEYCVKEPVEIFVVGMPKRMNNQPSQAAALVNAFISQLKKNFPEIPVQVADERFTSLMAAQTLLMSGIKKKERQNKELVDEISATIILQSYLESKR